VLFRGFAWLAIVGSSQHFSIATALLDARSSHLATWKLNSLQIVGTSLPETVGRSRTDSLAAHSLSRT